MAWDDDLVGVAKNIAAMDRTPLRVMAGPGTGKSFAMKRRVARLLEHGQSPKRILAVTFTRTAAASLVNDLRGLNVPGCESTLPRSVMKSRRLIAFSEAQTGHRS